MFALMVCGSLWISCDFTSRHDSLFDCAVAAELAAVKPFHWIECIDLTIDNPE